MVTTTALEEELLALAGSVPDPELPVSPSPSSACCAVCD